MNIIIFIIILSLLVLVHELGHFIAAKKNGILVEEFGFGLPPKILGIKINETLYSLNLLPIGGFVKLYGEEYQDIKNKIDPILEKGAFTYKTPWQKTIVLISGVIGNFLLGWFLISYLFTQGVPTPVNKIIVESVIKNSPAQSAGIKEKDIILKIKIPNNIETEQKNERKYQVKKGDYLWLIAQKYYGSGFRAYDIAKTNKIINPSLIYSGQMLRLPEIISTTPISKITSKPTEFVLQNTDSFIKLTKQFAGKKIIIEGSRNDKQIIFETVPRINPPQGQGPLGIVITSFMEKKYAWYQAPFFGLVEAVKITVTILKQLLKTIFLFITFQKPRVDVAGPIGIAQYASQAIKFGKNAVLELIGLLSLNLAVINILPFPALDGGRLIFVFYEWITKKKINEKIERNLNIIGFSILISLAILISINDIIKIYK